MDGKQAEMLGMVAGTMTTSSFIPQVYSIWSKTPKPADDISLGMFTILGAGILLRLVYGQIIRSRPVIIFNAISFILSMAVVTYKVIYG